MGAGAGGEERAGVEDGWRGQADGDLLSGELIWPPIDGPHCIMQKSAKNWRAKKLIWLKRAPLLEKITKINI